MRFLSSHVLVNFSPCITLAYMDQVFDDGVKSFGSLLYNLHGLRLRQTIKLKLSRLTVYPKVLQICKLVIS